MNTRRRTSDERGLLPRLLECHARIREMLADGSTIGELASSPDEARARAERLGRYFTRGLPLHTRDEEESLLPRLAGPELSAALDRMHSEHLQHEPLVSALVTACRNLVQAPPERSAALVAAVASAAEALAPGMAAHLEEEERTLFPGIARLDDAAQTLILEEMDQRREARG
jgi:iron-sulfur cluster repair protein YtfE (RIC family)